MDEKFNLHDRVVWAQPDGNSVTAHVIGLTEDNGTTYAKIRLVGMPLRKVWVRTRDLDFPKKQR